MLVAYFDESGHSADTEIVAVGGLVATEPEWDTFGRSWNEVLTRYGVRALHMRELNSGVPGGVGQFKGWSTPRRDALLADLLSVAADLPSSLVVTGISTADVRILTQEQKAMLGDPFFACLQEATRRMLIEAMVAHPQDFAVDLVCDRQKQFGASASRLLAVLQSSYVYGSNLRAVRTGISQSEPGLQLADLVTYELRKHWTNLRSVTPRPMRRSLKRLWQQHEERRASSVTFLSGDFLAAVLV